MLVPHVTLLQRSGQHQCPPSFWAVQWRLVNDGRVDDEQNELARQATSVGETKDARRVAGEPCDKVVDSGREERWLTIHFQQGLGVQRAHGMKMVSIISG